MSKDKEVVIDEVVDLMDEAYSDGEETPQQSIGNVHSKRPKRTIPVHSPCGSYEFVHSKALAALASSNLLSSGETTDAALPKPLQPLPKDQSSGSLESASQFAVSILATGPSSKNPDLDHVSTSDATPSKPLEVPSKDLTSGSFDLSSQIAIPVSTIDPSRKNLDSELVVAVNIESTVESLVSTPDRDGSSHVQATKPPFPPSSPHTEIDNVRNFESAVKARDLVSCLRDAIANCDSYAEEFVKTLNAEKSSQVKM